MNINYDYYRIFYFVAKYGNISQAAKLLLNNQPNLTRTIKNLESELGCPLFSRTNRGMRLTPEGQKLYEHIKVAIEHIEAGEEAITESKNYRRARFSSRRARSPCAACFCQCSKNFACSIRGCVYASATTRPRRQ